MGRERKRGKIREVRRWKGKEEGRAKGGGERTGERERRNG